MLTHRPLAVCLLLTLTGVLATAQPVMRDPTGITVLKPERVFDGEAVHEGWAVRVKGDRIDAVGHLDHLAGARIGPGRQV